MTTMAATGDLLVRNFSNRCSTSKAVPSWPTCVVCEVGSEESEEEEEFFNECE